MGTETSGLEFVRDESWATNLLLKDAESNDGELPMSASGSFATDPRQRHGAAMSASPECRHDLFLTHMLGIAVLLAGCVALREGSCARLFVFRARTQPI